VAGNRNKVLVEDFKFVLRKDPKKLARVEELLYMSEDIRRAKQLFDEKEMDPADEV
jgi:transcription initiation factor TFIID subunit 13